MLCCIPFTRKLTHMASYWLQKIPQQIQYLDVCKIVTNEIVVFISNPNAEEILEDIKDFISNMLNKATMYPIFWIFGANDDNAHSIEQQDFLTELEVTSEDIISKNLSLSYSDNIFVCFCWQTWLFRSKHSALESGTSLLFQSQNDFRIFILSDQIHRLLSMNTIFTQINNRTRRRCNKIYITIHHIRINCISHNEISMNF